MEFLTIPVIRLNGPGLYPGKTVTLVMRMNDELKELIVVLKKKEKQIAVFNCKDATLPRNIILPKDAECYSYGMLLQVNKVTGGENDQMIQLDVAVIDRIELLASAPKLYGNVHMLPMEQDMKKPVEQEEAYKEVLRDMFAEYIVLMKETSNRRGIINMERILEPLNLNYPLFLLLNMVMTYIEYRPDESYAFIATDDVEERYYICIDALKKTLEVKRIKKEISLQVQDNLQERQRQAILQEQMKVIRQEMDDGGDADDYQRKADELDAPEAVKAKLNKEIERLRRLPGTGNETALMMNYLDAVLEYPWNKSSEEDLSLTHAREVLDADHYGLEKVKERILEYLAVRSLSKEPLGSIICLVGPPGTGKTSVVRSVASALGRKYIRISLGGVHDEADIRGHRKTYVGAMPGRLVSAITGAGVNNPVILLDELDKLGQDMRGNPADALLEVLDSEQNTAFRDHYMELTIDLSKVIFIATANDRSRIPEALMDRLDMIEVDSYTAPEKYHIADRYLVSKQLKKTGLEESQLEFGNGVIEKIIEDYTREAGVRELERKIGTICRKAALKLIEQKKDTITVTVDNIEEFLGKPIGKPPHMHEDMVGIVHGLAWTSVGGVVLDVETAVLPGGGELILTGKMGDVMKESARIALSLVRSMSDGLELAENYFSTHSFHIHIPEGAVPKDGPSAGITLATALYSVISRQKVSGNVTMTGEVTLTGQVLAIGGLKEKLLAAKTAGYKSALVPESNRRDVSELSSEILGDMEISYVSRIDEVWKKAVLGYEGSDSI